MKRQSLLVITLLVIATLLLAGCSQLTSLKNVVQKELGQAVQSVEQPQATAVPAAPTTAQAAPAPVVSTGNSATLIAAYEGTLSAIYTQVNPSVVSIDVTVPGASIGLDQQIPGFPFQFNNPDNNFTRQALGSGFAWDTQGHIVTNFHVVDGATDIQVTFFDGTTVPATVVGSDPDSDLAVIKVDVAADQLHPVTMGDSSQVKVGEMAIAIGNPYGEEGTMTAGIISAIGRSLPGQNQDQSGSSYIIPDVIQTDAPINPGNSGGVLLNDQGQVIGVTSAIESASGSNAGIGYAIPGAIVQKVVPSLISSGEFAHPWLGISGTDLTSDLAQAMGLPATQHGALVITVTPGGPSEAAGLQGSTQQVTVGGQQTEVGGDVIVAIDGQPVKTFDDLPSYLARSQVGQTVTLTVLRGGKQQDIKVTLGSRPGSGAVAGATAVPPSGNPNQGAPDTGTTRRGRLGIVGVGLTPALASAMSLPDNQQGVLIEQVQPGSPADQAGLRGSYKPVTVDGQQQLVGGDVITALNGQAITGMNDLTTALQQYQAGQTVTLTLLRDGKEIQVQVTLANP